VGTTIVTFLARLRTSGEHLTIGAYHDELQGSSTSPELLPDPGQPDPGLYLRRRGGRPNGLHTLLGRGRTDGQGGAGAAPGSGEEVEEEDAFEFDIDAILRELEAGPGFGRAILLPVICRTLDETDLTYERDDAHSRVRLDIREGRPKRCGISLLFGS
jgi:hypothetical protein